MPIIRILLGLLLRRRAAFLIRLIGAPLLALLLRRLKNGGLQQLIGRARGAGLGGKVDSWISTSRKNQPLDVADVDRIIEPTEIRRISVETGLDEADVKRRVAEALPSLVDDMTPGGQVPSEGRLDRLVRRAQRALPKGLRGR